MLESVSNILPDDASHLPLFVFIKGHLQFSKYLDSIVQSRAFALAKSQPQTIEKASTSLAESIIRDGACQKYILLAMKQYSQTLQLSSAPLIVAQALPRLLSLWFELLSIQIPFIEGTGAEETSSRRRKSSSGMSKAQRKLFCCLCLSACLLSTADT